jgi:uncharacterized membrane protein
MMWGLEGQWAWLGFSSMVVVLAAIIAFGVWAVRTLSGAGEGEDRARRILRERFARGEIDQTAFEAGLRTLEQT